MEHRSCFCSQTNYMRDMSDEEKFIWPLVLEVCDWAAAWVLPSVPGGGWWVNTALGPTIQGLKRNGHSSVPAAWRTLLGPDPEVGLSTQPLRARISWPGDLDIWRSSGDTFCSKRRLWHSDKMYRICTMWRAFKKLMENGKSGKAMPQNRLTF